MGLNPILPFLMGKSGFNYTLNPLALYLPVLAPSGMFVCCVYVLWVSVVSVVFVCIFIFLFIYFIVSPLPSFLGSGSTYLTAHPAFPHPAFTHLFPPPSICSPPPQKKVCDLWCVVRVACACMPPPKKNLKFFSLSSPPSITHLIFIKNSHINTLFIYFIILECIFGGNF